MGNGSEFHYSLKNEWLKVMGNGFAFHYQFSKY